MTLNKRYLAVGAAALLTPLALALIIFPTAMIDTRELFAWGRFFPLATHKHPPMMALIGGLVESVLPANAFSAILIGQILNAIGIAYLYAILVKIVDRERAAFFAFLYATSLYFQLAPLSYALNADILQVPIWLAVVYHFIRAAETNAWRHWLALGAWAAAAVLTKYTAGLLFAAGAIATLVTPEFRRVWSNSRLGLAAAFGVLLIVPHLLALRANPAAIGYAEQFATNSKNIADQLRSIALFAGGTLMFLAPGWIIVVVGFATGNVHLDRTPASDTAPLRRFLAALGVASVGVSLTLIVFAGTLFNHRYSAPLFALFVMALAPLVGFRRATAERAITAAIWWSAAVIGVVFFGSAVAYGLFYGHNYMQEPTEEAAAVVRADWDKHYPCGPAYILGDRPSAHGIAIAGDRRGAGVPLEDVKVATWFDRSLLDRQGAIVAFRRPISPDEIEHAIPGTVIADEKSFTLPLKRTFSGATITYRYFFIPPRSCAIPSPSEHPDAP
jgi:4-amino-4-deoxy-L-arabinose transferase-like glycosyltransferase